ncbi:hypothetical protein [Kiloniella sp. EL199]|uniref:hypothetical protein n=1 Tax=Kiloniella sp. EL199 TaxID=2107581 RepID=UPI000EA2B91D|nr:hypothetical protein [Kiloniella sp. EL199]
MNIFEFITQDEIDALPDDPELAFIEFIHHAQKRLNQYTKTIDEEHEWHLIESAQHGFMNVTIAFAKNYKIKPFENIDVPRVDDRGASSLSYRQYQADLDHYMAQLLIGNSRKKKRDSVYIEPIVKDKIKSYINGLKIAIDNSEFSEEKRASLHEKLKKFERELEAQKLSIVAVTKLAFVILSAPGALWASYDVASKLTTNILQAVGEAKEVEDDKQQLPITETHTALIPPRRIVLDDEQDLPSDSDEIPF